MNTERIRQDRLEAIIREAAANPAAGPRGHTPHEVAMLAHEVAECRAGAGAREYELRNALQPLGSFVEAVRTLEHRGLLDLSPWPRLRDQAEDCHRALDRLNARPGPAGPEATFTVEAKP